MIEPERIARLPHDKRGYPVPWNVLKADDGTPFFTVNDDRKHHRALREGLCPICGETLGKWRWFVGGPGSAFDPSGWYLVLPGHRECMRYALATCPYLALPRYLHQAATIDSIPHADKLPVDKCLLMDETVDSRRPELFVAVGSERVQVYLGAPGLPRVRPQRAMSIVEFWRHGQQISQEAALEILTAARGEEWTNKYVRERLIYGDALTL